MKNLIRSAFVALALASSVLGLRAQVAVKVATVDLDQLFSKYYKTEAEIAKLNEQGKKAKEQVDAMLKEREDLVTAAKDLQDKFESIGFAIEPGTPEQLAARNRAETEKWGRAIRDAKIEPQ